MKIFGAFAIAVIWAQNFALGNPAEIDTRSGEHMIVERTGNGLQNVVTWDSQSLMIYGQRIFIFSGEFHPYRLPVPGLWLDIFQKVKAAGYSAVSFYLHWGLLEGQQGVYNASGVFALEPFLEAALEAGVYLIARPGPYINAESSGGGFPGWVQRLKGQLRTRASDYLSASDIYMSNVGAAFAKYQITNGGPVILVQPENEYTSGYATAPVYFPDPVYFSYLKTQLHNAGVVVPLTGNNERKFAPGVKVNGTTSGDFDIWGYDSYPLGFNCGSPSTWGASALGSNYYLAHKASSPSSFNAATEYQGGSYDNWGGAGFDSCAALTNMEFARVFYKNNYASGVALMNTYMVYGGTNWGNTAYPAGYTSYDYGAPITENRELNREKYSEIKLQTNFLKVSPAYLSATVGFNASNDAITISSLLATDAETAFYIVRHTDYQELISRSYTLGFSTSIGTFTVPQLGGMLTLSARDSKWHVTDYDVGGTTILYSTAEIFTWKKFPDKTVVVVYGGPGERHELAVLSPAAAVAIEGTGVTTKTINGSAILNWQTSTTRRVVQVGSTFIYILDRNTAYNYWVPDFGRTDIWQNFTANVGNTTSLIVQAGYLVRRAYMDGSALHIDGDLNATVPIKVIGAPVSTTALYFNNQQLDITTNSATGELSSILTYTAPSIKIPAMSWTYLDGLPEIQSTYDDTAWTVAGHKSSPNPRPLDTPTSLYGSDYGYNAGALIYRGKFEASGSESTFNIVTQGGDAYGCSVWLNSTFLGSWAGTRSASNHSDTFTLPPLASGQTYIITVVIDQTGLEESHVVGADLAKTPRGIMNYALSSHPQSDITWKVTGNLGGEKYMDKVRGPMNEGGLYAERQGYTQPNPPSQLWTPGNPMTGINHAGIAFYQTSLNLNFPKGYDIPLVFNFGKTANSNYQVQLWVNGYQFGKYINNIGPQTSFPVPQGILNYYGANSVALEIWARDAAGAHLTDFSLQTHTPVMTSFGPPALVGMPSYSQRASAY